MSRHDALTTGGAAETIAYLKQHEEKSMLRFITCGSVDDGKSTLIGRLLYETKLIFEDQLAALERDSRKVGTRGDAIDFALLVDGLAAEREQGITIDVAYRFFTTDSRKYIVADTPGHEQYTRNMATGASTAELAVVMIDARKGVLTQTRRHSFIVSMLGVRHVVVCINKMDLVDYDQHTYNQIDEEYRSLATQLGIQNVTVIPVSAVEGDNVVERSQRTPWYTGPTLMHHLDSVEVDEAERALPLRMPVQWVNRPSPDFRGFSGRIETGTVKPGEVIKVMPSAREAVVKSIVTYNGDLEEAVAGQSVTLTLDRETDVSRGNVIVPSASPCEVSDQFEARLLWMASSPMLPGRSYVMKLGGMQVNCTPLNLKHTIQVNTFEHLPATKLGLNEIGIANISLDREIPFDPYDENRSTGGFILIDRQSNETVGLGLLNFALRRATNVHRQELTVDKASRAAMKGQKPVVLWMTGLSGSGKSTIADSVSQRLLAIGRHAMVLDGDNVRHGLNRDLGFTDADRVENIRRIAEVSKLMVEAGLITLVSFISPFRAERAFARSLFEDGEFIEIFIDTALDVAEARDVKGLYKQARAGQLPNFTGIGSAYEPPEAPDIHIDTARQRADAAADQIIAWLKDRGYFTA
ncbi:MAG: sulfate adenylyltransferase subunit CysN [Devosiaceae bacterium]